MVNVKRAVLILFALYTVSLFVSMAGMESFSALLAILALIKVRREWQGFGVLRIGPDVWILIYVAAVCLSAAINSVSTPLMVDMIGWCRWAILLYSMTWLLRVALTPQLERWHWIFLFLAIPIGFNSIYQFFTGIDFTRPDLVLDQLGNYYRASGFFKMGLTFAYSIGMIGMTAFALGLVRATRKDTRATIYAGVVFAFVTLSVILSMTRGAWIALGVAAALGIYLVSRRWFLYFVPTTLTAFLFAAMSNLTLRERLLSLVDGHRLAGSTRLIMWKTNLLLFWDHPLLGVGFFPPKEMFHTYYLRLGANYMQFYGHAHSDLLEMLSGTGIFGFLSYVLLCVYFLRLAYRLWMTLPLEQTWYRSLALGALLAQVYFHVGGLTQCNFTDGEVNHVLIFMWAILGAMAFQQTALAPTKLRALRREEPHAVGFF